MSIQLFVNDSRKHLDYNWNNSHRTIVVYVFSIALLKKMSDSRRFPVFWEFTLTIANRLIKNIAHIGTQMRSAHSRIPPPPPPDILSWGLFLERPGKLSGPLSHSVSPRSGTLRVFLETPVICDPINLSGNLPGHLREVLTSRKVTEKSQMSQN